jgi:hypothetical protein
MMIELSLNEVETAAAKAARGAGLSWGMAEETGKAARWLAGCGLDWAPSLIALLGAQVELAAPVTRLPAPLGTGRADLLLSPLAAGAYLEDLGPAANHLALQATARPLWLLPFAARMASALEAAVVIGWEGLSVTVWPFGGDLAGNLDALNAAVAKAVTWSHFHPGDVAATPTRTLTRASRSIIATGDWQALNRLGARTYVPASDISRAKGAGAGAAVDND